jgi:hypothetical protein
MINVTGLLVLWLLSAPVVAEPANVAGVWNCALQLEVITGHPVLTFKQDGEKLTGTYEGRYGPSALTGAIKEKSIAFKVKFVAEGSETEGVFVGTVDGDNMSGTVEFEGAGSGTWTAARAKPSKLSHEPEARSTVRASPASEPRDRSAPAKRRVRARIGESEGRRPSEKE